MKRIIAGLLCLLMLNISFPVVAETDARDDYVQNLIELEIVDKDDIREDDYLTYTECFNFFLRTLGENKIGDLEYEWKYGGYKKLMGDRPDWQKEIICKTNFLIVLTNEWKDIDFDANCTYESAILYCARAIVNIGGCVWSPATYQSTETLYNDAFSRGLIESIDISSSEKTIKRGEFFKLLNKTIYTEYTRGGYGGTWQERIIDKFVKSPEPSPTPSYEDEMQSFIDSSKLASIEEMTLAQNTSIQNYGLLDSFPEEVDMDRSATRAELAVIISRLMGYTYVGSFQFEDFDHSLWYGNDFSRAAFYYIINGYDDYVRPDDDVTCEEANIMLSRAFAIDDYHGISGDPNSCVSFNEIFDAINNMVDVYYTLPRIYDNEQNVINGNVFIMSPNTVLKNTVINGNLYIAENVCSEQSETFENNTTKTYNGLLALDNVTVTGDIVIANIQGKKFYLIDCDINTAKWLRSDMSSSLFITYRNDAPILDSGKNMKLNNDFSLTWELPENQIGLGIRYNYAFNEDGKRTYNYGGGTHEPIIDTLDMLNFAISAYPKKLSRVEISYRDRTPLTIDLDNITVKEDGTALVPNTLVNVANYISKFTLTEGEFKEGKWYCVTTRYQDPYEPEENEVILTKKDVYLAKESGKSCSFNYSFGDLNDNEKDITIQEITINGDAESGFEIILTPESEQTFTKAIY